MVEGSIPVAVALMSDFAPASSKEFHDFQAVIECRFTLKCVRDMIRTYNQILVFCIFFILALADNMVKKVNNFQIVKVQFQGVA